MKHANILLVLVVGVLLATAITACSKGKSPVEVGIGDVGDISQDVPISFGTESDHRSVLAVYNAVIDPNAKTFTVESANRSCEYHVPLNTLYPNVLEIIRYGWTPNLWADIQISHPFPGSGIDAFDPRVIAILPANPGVSMNYPIFNVYANNSVVLEPDGYTKMYDNIGGSIVGNTNPFIAYYKHGSNRKWFSNIGYTEEHSRWQMNYAGFGGPVQFMFVVDVSTNYPDPSQPVIDNILEPVEMYLVVGDGLTPTGGSATVTATILDWQGPNEIKCKVEAPDLFNGAVQLFYTGPGSEPDEYIFSGTITNELGAPYGSYKILLAAWDINVGNHTFIESYAPVEFPFDPVLIQPLSLNLLPDRFFIQDNYLYALGEERRFHIFDISDPLNPVWINKVDFTSPGDAKDLFVSDGYAYVLLHYSKMVIIDIDPPEEASVVTTCTTSNNYSLDGIYVEGDYAYVVTYDGIDIIDINPPEEANIVITAEVPGYATDVSVCNGYAFVANVYAKMYILDIDPPESACVVGSVATDGSTDRIITKDGFAYLCESTQMDIIDIDPPLSAFLVKSVDTSYLRNISVSDGYAYLTGRYEGVEIIDVDPPESACIVNSLPHPQRILDVVAGDDYAYMACEKGGWEILDIQTPESAEIVKTIVTTNDMRELVVEGDYVYVACGISGLVIIDATIPESSYIVNSVDTSSLAEDICISDGYAYVADKETGLVIIDIEPPESAHTVNTIDISGQTRGVCVSGNYAYVTDMTSEQVFIIDISFPESAFIVNSVSAVTSPYNIHVSGDYAYVTGQPPRLFILDISPPESAYIVTTVETPGNPKDVFVADGYAYIADRMSGLHVVDIDPVESAFLVNTLKAPNECNDVFVVDGYAYMTHHICDFSIVNISLPTHEHVVEEVRDSIFEAEFIYVSNGMAYITDRVEGLRIIDLW